jgi:hypothetical protein
VYGDPGAAASTGAAADRLAHYQLLWAYYNNSAFGDLGAWLLYRQQHGLYRGVRPIYNPTRRLVDFYAGVIYQGEWAIDPAQMVQKTAAIPWGERTPVPLLGAVAQVYQWSNWQAKKALMLRYAAAAGDCLVTVVDDLERAKVYPDVIWPGIVTDIQLDPTGNVTAYTLEYDAATLDAAGKPTERTYRFKREVTKATITEYADDAVTSRAANPYGFVPACWVQHSAAGGQHGEPALRALGKVDELNALAAHALDQAHRVLEAPILLSGDGMGGNLEQQSKAPSGVYPGRVMPQPQPERETLKIITAQAGAHIEAVTLPPGEALEHIDRLLAEIERDHPELGMYAKLREMSTVTGPGADRMFGDVAALVGEARAQYDQQTTKLFQMCIAIAGWRAASGAWGLRSQLSSQQTAFAGFDLDSYARGDLDLSIQSRPLVLPSPEDELRLEQMRAALDADKAMRATSDGTPAGVADRLRQAVSGQVAAGAQGTGTRAVTA